MINYISLEIKTIEINDNEHLTDVFKKNNFPLEAIPTNCILDKTLPGLGATYSEIKAKRNSIIIEPNVPVIMGKVNNDNSLLGVYESIKEAKIKNYLLNDTIIYKKILCTPEAYMRVVGIAEDVEIDLFNNYFCLYDECEKITQDIDYREQISLPMNDFFLYRDKAFVSATPLQLRNPEFEEQNFFILKVKPTFEFRKKINLITTNNYESSVVDLLEELKDSPCVCIFMNSTNGINKLITRLEENNITDYKAFCSKKSEIKFKSRDIHQSFEDLDLPLAKYNFFTSRFYSAVDIYTTVSPDIIILTDLHEAKHSRIDPLTNAIQIYGRFRNKHDDGQKFNSLTHISNYGTIGEVLTEQEIESYIDTSKQIYEGLKIRFEKAENEGEKKSITDTLKTCSYNKFTNEDDTLNYFKIDNFYDDERVRGYYLTPDNLVQAYESTNHFIIEHSNPLYIVGDKELFYYKKAPSRIEQRKFLVKKLHTIYTSGEYTSEELLKAEADFLRVDRRDQLEEAKFTIGAFKKLGKDQMERVGYYKNQIEKLLSKDNKKTNEQKMFSKEVRDAILKRFPEENTYKQEDLFNGFDEIFKSYGITSKVNKATIKKYYGVRESKAKDEIGNIRLDLFRPNKEYL
jgi:hypothetical protein